MRRLVLAVAVTSLFLSGCPAAACDPANGGGACGAGEACTSMFACGSGWCEAGRCAAPCDGPRDCASGQFCIAQLLGGGGGCIRSCIGELLGEPGEFCANPDAAGTCATVANPDDYCDQCGCAAAGAECVGCPGLCDCRVPAALGEACAFGDGCASGNCVGPSGSRRCELAAGTACGGATSPDCTRCDGTGMTCRAGCRATSDCGGGLCIGDRSTEEYYCYVDCSETGACPAGATCVDTSDFTARYCRPGP